LKNCIATYLIILLNIVLVRAQTEDEFRISNQFIVQVKPSSTIENVLRDFASLKMLRCLSKQMNIFLAERNSNLNEELFLDSLKKNSSVKIAQFNHRIQQRSLIPNDADFGMQWNMMNTGQSAGIAGADIEATEAWSLNTDMVTTNGDSVVIAIVDEKFDLNHEDLNYYVNRNEVPDNGIDDDGNGYIDDYYGWNVFTNTGEINSITSNARHSTHLCGIAAGIGNNTKGIAGVSWGAKILAISGSSETESDVVAAYDYVITMRRLYDNTSGAKGAYIVTTNSSFGVNNGRPADFPIWCALYDTMGTIGIISVGATANSNLNVDEVYDMPTACPSPWLVSVTNTSRFDTKVTNAAYGKTSIDLGAPGQGIYSTLPDNTYGILSGTSMSAPHVAGTIAAMYATACKGMIDASFEKPDSIALLMKDYLLEAVEFNSTLNNITTTNGRLNVYRALRNLSRYNCDSCNFDLSIAKVPLRCYGINDGAMAAQVIGNVSDYQFFWSTGHQSIECLSMAPGFYSVIATDTTGCRRTFTDELHYPDTILINAINIVPANDSANGNITIVASAGNDTLMYSIDGITYQYTATFSVATNGNYTVYIKNSEGCVVMRNILVSGLVDSFENLEFVVFPNPAKDFVTVQFNQTANAKVQLSVCNILGEELLIIDATNTNSIQLPLYGFSSGIYFIRVKNRASIGLKKFVISK
jgi:hypothetical protein